MKKYLITKIMDESITSEESTTGQSTTPSLWHRLGMRWVNSVLQLTVTQLVSNPRRPYSPPTDKIVRGTGFVIDATKGLIATSSQVVMGALTITGNSTRFGKRDFTLKVVSICQEKGLALVQLIPEDIRMFNQGYNPTSELNMIFGDSMDLEQGQEVMAIGYPLGEGEVKYTTGIISGFKSNVENITNYDGANEEDAKTREPTYIQVTTTLTFGNVGGPLIDSNGKVVGMCTQRGSIFLQSSTSSMGMGMGSSPRRDSPEFSSGYSNGQCGGYPHGYPPYAPNNYGQYPSYPSYPGTSSGYIIASRTILSVICFMKKSLIVNVPTFGLGWSNSTRELMVDRCGAAKIHGIYVRRVDADSCFSNLQVGDVITHLFYDDPFWKMKRTSNDRSTLTVVEKDYTPNDCLFVCGYFDRFGDLVLHQADRNNKGAFEPTPKDPNLFLSTRKLSLAEVTDMIPIGSKVQLQICRDKQWYRLDTQYLPTSKGNRIPTLVSSYQPFDYEVFSGISCTPISRNLISEMDRLKDSLRGTDRRYGKFLVVNQVFPGTSISKSGSFREGEILDKVNGEEMRTLEDLRKILGDIVRGTNPSIEIQLMNGSLFLGLIDSLRLEDQTIIDSFAIDPEKAIFGEFIQGPISS